MDVEEMGLKICSVDKSSLQGTCNEPVNKFNGLWKKCGDILMKHHHPMSSCVIAGVSQTVGYLLHMSVLTTQWKITSCYYSITL